MALLLHRYAAARLGSADAASDVVQTVFLRAVKHRKRFRTVENPAAYVFKIARNETMRLAGNKARRRETLLVVDDVDDGLAKPASGAEAEVVAAALARLDADDRELVALKVFGGLTFAEIGVVVDRPPATVATRYRRALESLGGWLERQFQ